MRLILDDLRIRPETVTPLAGDASSRRFFRLSFPKYSPQETAILIAFPPGDNIIHYARISECLQKAKILSPKIFRADSAQGYLIIEDLGDELLQKTVISSTRPKVLSLYRKAIDQLLLMQERLRPEIIPDCPAWRQSFDEKKFLRELNFFLKHTVEGYYQREISAADRKSFQKYFLLVCQQTLSQTQVFCHRDYHSRNLLVQKDEIRIVDFQDARRGPYTYDLVSLLHDPYVDLATNVKETLAAYYYSRRPEFLGENLGGKFRKDCDMMSLQRILKAAGTFGYMFVEKGKRKYIEYLPAALRIVMEVLERHPELIEFRELLIKYLAQRNVDS